ncbi:hypothetical protein UFOVP233_23 [uncultured Caudovirales phage]|uniref:Uncharacterized protein n=1 Tax=uncultured Caudovirales phage TaxID=2100421 RepID=A0A6J7WTT5_9CAUD|nr:hypothetical protein UFOVP233_23 [uncultured Caudovirales phage]
MARKRKARGRGGRPPAEKKPISLAPTSAPIIRDTGAAPVSLVSSGADFTEFSRNADQAPVVVHRKVTRVYSVPLDYYQHRKLIDSEQWAAGERLMAMHRIAFGSGYHSVNLDGFHGTSSYADNWRVGVTQGDVLREYIRTLGMFTRQQQAMLENVCCRGEYAGTVAQRISVNPKKAVDFLRAALTLLAGYWRTGKIENAPAGQGRGAGAIVGRCGP